MDPFVIEIQLMLYAVLTLVGALAVIGVILFIVRGYASAHDEGDDDDPPLGI